LKSAIDSGRNSHERSWVDWTNVNHGKSSSETEKCRWEMSRKNATICALNRLRCRSIKKNPRIVQFWTKISNC
jgi:hypothetical protein